MQESFKLYRKYPDYFQANVFIQHLIGNDIPYTVKHEALNTIMPNVFGGIEIWIPESYFEELDTYLEDLERVKEEESQASDWSDAIEEEFDKGNKICVHCGSMNTKIYEEDPYSLWHKFVHRKKSEKEVWHCFHCGKKF